MIFTERHSDGKIVSSIKGDVRGNQEIYLSESISPFELKCISFLFLMPYECHMKKEAV